jgi:hypothetical protein
MKMSNEDIVEFRGLLVGMKEDIGEIKKDIIYIKSNDKEKVQRIRSLETHHENDMELRKGHIKANQKFREDTNIKINNR